MDPEPAESPAVDDDTIDRIYSDLIVAVPTRERLLRRLIAACTPEQRAGAIKVAEQVAASIAEAVDKGSATVTIPIACNVAELPCYELAVATWGAERTAPPIRLKLTAPGIDVAKLDERQRAAVALFGKLTGVDTSGQAVGYIHVSLLEGT